MTHRLIPLISSLALAALCMAPASALAAPVMTVVTVTTTAEKPPTCQLTATRTHIHSGDTTVLRWKSEHAQTMVGLGDPKPSKGSARVAIAYPGVRTFTLWFVGPGGSISCSVAIHVSPKS